MSLFDETRYRGLLERLEISEVKRSQLERTSRLDAEFFQKRHVALESKFVTRVCQRITEVATISDGNHFSISDNFVEEGIPYYRGQDAAGHFFIEQATPNNITVEAFKWPALQRSHLQEGDVLLSIIGTVGEASLVKTSQDATCSCKLAILRPMEISPEYLATYLSSGIGHNLSERWKRGAVQTGLLLKDMDQLPIPRFGSVFENRIVEIVDLSYESLEEGRRKMAQAETTLLCALNLENWKAPEPLSYVRGSGDVFAAGRLDADYFAPSVQTLLLKLGSDCLTIGDVASARHEKFKLDEASETFDYIEIGNICGDGSVESTEIETKAAPSRATQHVHVGDVLTSTVRPIRRLSALVTEGQDGAVCSSGFVVLQPKTISSATLLTYLRLLPVCELMNLHTSASMYPAISETDLLSMPIPKIPKSVQTTIDDRNEASRQSRQRATQLLEAAKRAVEIAIEDSETAALAFLDAQTAT
ncbi:MAG: hypothetical protein LBS70_08250 [Candidatus Accumulibacter sp.]|jgi:restriction endonuclease S subunit|nr:hypothetical protein [Accumulibacter sp.]